MPEGKQPDQVEATSVRATDDWMERIEDLLADSRRLDATERAIVAAARVRARELAASEHPQSHHLRLGAIVFLADSLTGLAIERGVRPEETQALFVRVADRLDLPADYVEAVVFLRAIRNPRLLSLPTRLAVELQLELLVALTAVAEASLWTMDGTKRLQCLIHVGGPPTRRMRAAAKQVLGRSSVEGGSGALVHAVPVSRWDQPFAALAIRTRTGQTSRSIAFADETAAALGVALERETLLERSMARERSIIEAGERRFVRLGFDIHDGPIQDIAALAGDLHLFKRQLAGVLPQGDFEPLLGRVDDLQARLEQVDRELRELAQSLEAPSILRKPLEDILRREADAFAVASDIQAKLELSGNFGEMTASQRIALVRVVQEGLTNIREHSGATRVEISVAVRPGYVQATITDNGRGFDVEKALVRAARGGRLGLVGMSERIRLLGGTFDLQSRIGGPTTISATLPEWRPLATDEVAERGA